MEVNDSLADPMYVTSRSIVSTTTTSFLFALDNDSSDQNDQGQDNSTSGSLMIENVSTTSANVTDTSEDDRSTSIKVYKC